MQLVVQISRRTTFLIRYKATPLKRARRKVQIETRAEIVRSTKDTSKIRKIQERKSSIKYRTTLLAAVIGVLKSATIGVPTAIGCTLVLF